MTSEKPRRLGRGLEALLSMAPAATSAPSSPQSAQAATATGEAAPRAGRDGLQELPVAAIRPNPYQPRKEFKPEELADLEASLRASGLLQPITVRRAPNGQGYELV